MRSKDKVLEFSAFLWGIFLVLNLINLAKFIKFSGTFYSIFWFGLSIFSSIFIYTKFSSYKNLSRILLFIVAFVGGFFTSYLYYGFIEANTLYFAFLSSIIALGLTLGVGILI